MGAWRHVLPRPGDVRLHEVAGTRTAAAGHGWLGPSASVSRGSVFDGTVAHET